MAYWLGFLFADGCITTRKDATIHQTVVRLKCTDIEHLKKLNSEISSEYPISISKQTLSTFCAVRTYVYGKEMFEDLKNLGCVERKSKHLEWPPALPCSLENHFVRGYFDGDGSIYVRSKTQITCISFVGTASFISSLQKCINENVQQTAKGCIFNSQSYSSLYYGGTKSVLAVTNWMYQNCTKETRLDRKYALFCHCKKTANLPKKERKTCLELFQQTEEWTKYKICNNCLYKK